MELWGPEIKISEKCMGEVFSNSGISGVIFGLYLYITGFFGPTLFGWTALSCVELGEPDLRLGVFRESSKDLPLAVQKPMVFFVSYTYLAIYYKSLI